MKKYVIRQGSIADYGRIALAGLVFWSMIIITAVMSYPV